MKNQPIQINPNKDIPQDQKKKDLEELNRLKKIKESSTTGEPEGQETGPSKEINPFSND